MKFTLTLLLFFLTQFAFTQLPKGFVYAQDSLPDLKVELRYYYDNNFVGKQIDGYVNEVVITTTETMEALKKVQADLKAEGLTLKVFDAYRPQRAVNHFVHWAKQVNDTMMKHYFYPNVEKRHLFKDGYIASKSRHSSGSTLDVTIVNLETGKELDMGSPFDFFGKESWVTHSNLTKKQMANRQRLQHVMLKNGFINYPQEWWHFTIKNEPFKNRYFDFLVE